jgi:hypothetical protein
MKRALASPELIVVVVLALVIGALSASTRSSSADIELTAGAGGSLTLSNSNEGSAILALGGMRPGDSVDGTVTIGNTGTLPGDLALSISNLVDTPGAGGGALSGELDLVITDITNSGSPVVVYTGKIAALTPAALGTLAAGVSRTYEFRVLFPDAGLGAENAYQGSAMSVQFDWTATNNDPDTDPPETTVTSAPGGLVAGGDATFSFIASEAGSSFECSLDGAPFGACTSPAGYSGLADGAHSFDVRATDGAGNTDPSPAQHAWTVDSTPPSATMNDPGAYLRGTVTLTSTSGDSGSGVASVTYQRSPAGAGAWAAIPASWNTTGVADGLHDLRVVVTDNAGNSTTSAPVTDRRVDNTKPSLDSSTPADGSTIASASSIQLVAGEDVAGVANAQLDGAPAPAPTVSGSTVTYTATFDEGPHTLSGELEDLAGNRRPIRVHFTVWSLAAADYPYVEKNSYSTSAMSVRSASDTTTVTVPAAGWTGAPAGDWLVVRVDPSPAGAVGNGFAAGSEILDVSAYWALSGAAVHSFAKPIEIAVDSSDATVVPATLVDGKWRAMKAIPGGGQLPAGWEDGFVRGGSSVRILSRHLSFFTLLKDVQAPSAPAGFKGTLSRKSFLLSWKAATDNSGTVVAYRVYANGAVLKSVAGGSLSAPMGAFRTSDTRSFQVAAVDEAGNVGPKSYALRVVPKLAKMTLATAKRALVERGFRTGRISYTHSATVPAGSVVSVKSTGLRRAGTKVGLTVSSGAVTSPRTNTSSPPPPTSPSSTPPPSYYSGFMPFGSTSPSSTSTPAPQIPPVPPSPAAGPEPAQRIEQIEPAANAQEASRLRRLLGYGLLALAFGVALFTGLRLYRPRPQAPAARDELEPLVLWDARLMRAAAGAVRRLAGRS